jgi:diketogulonate reductase-like aldo/keto reductase
LYLIHWPATGKWPDSWRALEEIYISGRAKSIGVSNFTVRLLEDLLAKAAVVPMVNQISFHIFNYQQQAPILEYCRSNNIVVEAYSPLAQSTNLQHQTLQSIATELQRSPAQVMLRWCIQHGTIPLPKSENAERQKENIDIFDFELSSVQMEQLNNISST